MDTAELNRLLRQGIAAAQAGDKERARELLLHVIELDEEVETAWLWLSGVVDDPEEKQICLENVLTLNPDNTAAQAGLRYLAEQSRVQQNRPTPVPSEHRPMLTPVPADPSAPDEAQESIAPSAEPALTTIEIDPFGCPYCGGPLREEEPRCAHCDRLVTVRYRKREPGAWLGWLVFAFVLLGVASWGEGLVVSQLVEMGRLPEWLTQTAVRFLVGSALFSPVGLPGELVEFADTIILLNSLIAGLCLLAALGLALRFRAVYFGAFLLIGVLVVGIGVGLLTQLVGWIPALLRLGLVALTLKWLADSAPGFEWDIRYYNADVDQDLQNALDYYNRGRRYRDMRMWAKTAAHWKVAKQLDSSKTQYCVALAQAYAQMGYPAAALTEVEKALARTPNDGELRAFRDSLAAIALEAAE